MALISSFSSTIALIRDTLHVIYVFIKKNCNLLRVAKCVEKLINQHTFNTHSDCNYLIKYRSIVSLKTLQSFFPQPPSPSISMLHLIPTGRCHSMGQKSTMRIKSVRLKYFIICYSHVRFAIKSGVNLREIWISCFGRVLMIYYYEKKGWSLLLSLILSIFLYPGCH